MNVKKLVSALLAAVTAVTMLLAGSVTILSEKSPAFSGKPKGRDLLIVIFSALSPFTTEETTITVTCLTLLSRLRFI